MPTRKGRQLLLPESERQHRLTELEVWGLTKNVARMKAEDAQQAETEASGARVEAMEARLAANEARVARNKESCRKLEWLSTEGKEIVAKGKLVERAERAEKQVAEMQALREWGPDHASRPPRAVYDMRGATMKLKSIQMEM